MKNNLSNKIYRAICKGLLEGLDLNDLDIEDFSDIKIKKVANSKRSILKAILIENNYRLQTIIDSEDYSIEEVYNLAKQGAIYKANDNTLKTLINQYIEIAGNGCDLNWIDTSKITNMKKLFKESKFNGDISNWDVSNVTDMSGMFDTSKFNGDISEWNISNVNNIYAMFHNSKFNGDISSWDVSNVKDMSYMFFDSQFDGDISSWDVSNVKDMYCMFMNSKFNGDISNWNINLICDVRYIFDDCPIKEEYKPKFK